MRAWAPRLAAGAIGKKQRIKVEVWQRDESAPVETIARPPDLIVSQAGDRLQAGAGRGWC